MGVQLLSLQSWKNSKTKVLNGEGPQNQVVIFHALRGSQDLNRDLPLARTAFYHYTGITCLHIPFSFLTYYTKLSANDLFEALNEF